MLLPFALLTSGEITGLGAKGCRSRTERDKGMEQLHGKWELQELPGHRLSLTFSEELPLLSLFSHYFPHPTASSCTRLLSDSQISQAFSDTGP